MFQTITLDKPLFRDFFLVLLASLMISLSGIISIPLWFSPVPLAMQPHVVLLTAALLGSRKGTLATLSFLMQGAMGLPVFSGGKGGLFSFVGPTGGYLIGYLIAAFVVGFLVEKMREKNLIKSFFALATGNALIYLSGASYLSAFLGIKNALLLGIAPFLIGDLFKLLISMKMIQKAWKYES